MQSWNLFGECRLSRVLLRSAFGIALLATISPPLTTAQQIVRHTFLNGSECIARHEGGPDSSHPNLQAESLSEIRTPIPISINNNTVQSDCENSTELPFSNELVTELRQTRKSIVDENAFVDPANSADLIMSPDSYFEFPSSGDLHLESSLNLATVCPIIVTRANTNFSGQALLAPYHARIGNYQVMENTSTGPELHAIPPEYVPWWLNFVRSASGPNADELPVSLDTLLQSALQHSPFIQIAATEPHIRQSTVFEEAAQFDWRTFLETNYNDTNDPIGNELTTGNNADRFVQEEWFGRGGVRRRNQQGGEIDILQRVGYLNNNSVFLDPPDQGNTRLELNYRQPLLRGRGTAVNESLIVLAEIDYRSASDDFLEQLQSQLAEITATYWELLRARSEYFQRLKLLEGAERILVNLLGRAEVDALDRQILRAQAAVSNRRAEIARSLTSIRNAESRLRLLVNEPSLANTANMEWIPLDLPDQQRLPINLADAVSTAIANRPDISRAIRDLGAAHVRLGVARNDVLPRLDFLIGSYVAGLDGDSDISNSWLNQFRDGRPGFNFGLEYELPVGNRGAQAARQRRQWEVTRSLHQFRAVVETGLTDVEIAVREVETTHQEMTGRYHAMQAAANETEYLIDRWQTLPGIDDSVTLLLEDLLDSQERLADEEAAFSQAQFDYAVAIVDLKQAMGTLFIVQPDSQ